MLDKSYVRALQVGNMITVRGQHREDLTIFPVDLILREEGKADFRILSERLDCEGRGEDIYAAFESLSSQLLERDLILCCCGYCWFFQLTGLSRQMSSGENGYCRLFAKDHGRSLADVVAIFDSCDFFKYGPQGLVKELDQQIRKKG